MRSTAVLSLLWPKHLDALEEFLGRRPVDTVIVPSGLACERLRVIGRAAGSSVVVLDDFTPAGGDVQQKVVQSLKGLHRHLDQSPWAPDVTGRGTEDDVDSLRELVRRRIDRDVPPAVELLQQLATVGKEFDLRLLVTSEDVTPQSKIATAWARCHQVPSLHLAHSLALVDPYTVHADMTADVLAVYGQRGAEGYLDLGLDPRRIVITGNPAWDGYSSLRHERVAMRAAMIEKHDLPSNQPLIVFGTTFSAHLTARDVADAYRSTLSAFLSSCAQMQRQGVRCTIVVKDRQDHEAAHSELFERILAESGISGPVLRTAEDGSRWAAAADALIAVDSNYLVEAMLCGTPAVNLIGIANLPGPPPFDGASGVIEANAEELADRVRELLEDDLLRKEHLTRAASRLEHYHHGGTDGRAAERVAVLMARLADAGVKNRHQLRQRVSQRLRHSLDVLRGKARKER